MKRIAPDAITGPAIDVLEALGEPKRTPMEWTMDFSDKHWDPYVGEECVLVLPDGSEYQIVVTEVRTVARFVRKGAIEP